MGPEPLHTLQNPLRSHRPLFDIRFVYYKLFKNSHIGLF